MAKRITSKVVGSGSKGFTHAHNGADNEPITHRKGHITCVTQAQVDITSAWLGMVKRFYKVEQLEYMLIDSLQDCMMNIGAMIFTSKYATYEVNTNTVIDSLLVRLEFINATLETTEFIKYGADEVSAYWGLLTTQIRLLETQWVKWIDESSIVDSKKPQYELQVELINLMSKWSYSEYRYYCKTNNLFVSTWQSNFDDINNV
jgi:cob(I)alamin adenosyltransferase